MIYIAPSKRDIDRACLLVNGLTAEQRTELLAALRASSSQNLLTEHAQAFEPFSIGFLLGYMVREVRK